MNILFHTIALEPNRWTPARVSRPLAELLPAIESAGFRELEIFEPHLALAPNESALPSLLARHHLTPVILSSYLDLSAATAETFAGPSRTLLERLDRFGFRKVRLFPGRSPSPGQTEETIRLVSARLQSLADERPGIEFLLETHDGSLADDPACMPVLVERCARPNIGLLWQPTIFEPAAARAQFSLQKPCIRHVHLQNRAPDLSFAKLASGIIPWRELLAQLTPEVGATLEFVPSGICPLEAFDLQVTLQEAVEESRFAASLR